MGLPPQDHPLYYDMLYCQTHMVRYLRNNEYYVPTPHPSRKGATSKSSADAATTPPPELERMDSADNGQGSSTTAPELTKEGNITKKGKVKAKGSKRKPKTLEESTDKWIGELYYSNSSEAKGPECACIPNERGVKCYDKACNLYKNKIECNASCGSQCQNQVLTRNVWSRYLQIRPVDGYGKALLSIVAIPEGARFLEYVGMIVPGKIRHNQLHCYPLRRLSHKTPMYINQDKQANESRFLCHSTNSNCMIEEFVVGRQLRLVVVAKRKIPAEEVLTIEFPNREPNLEVGINEEFDEGSYTIPQPMLLPPKFFKADSCIEWNTDEWTKDEELQSMLRKNFPEKPLYYFDKNGKARKVIKPAAKKGKKGKSPATSSQAPSVPPYICRSNNCYQRYTTRDEMLAHLEAVHTAKIPELRSREMGAEGGRYANEAAEERLYYKSGEDGDTESDSEIDQDDS